MTIRDANELNFHFRGRRTNRPTHTSTVMRPNLWGGNPRSVREYVYSHVLRSNALPSLCCLPPPSFSLILHSGAETAQIMYALTACSTIVIFRPDSHLDHFALYARKQDRKMGVAHLVIFCYLPRITPIRAPTTPLLTSILSYA